MALRMKDTRNPDLVSLTDVAVALGVSQPTVSRLLADGQLQPYSVPEKRGPGGGHTVWIHKDELDRLKREYVRSKGGRGRRRQLVPNAS